MELQYFGANCVRVATKKSVIVIDPASDVASLKPDLKKVDAVLVTQPQYLVPVEVAFIIDGPGEYEFSDYSVKGIATQPHTGASGDKGATILRLSTVDTSILFVGNIDSKLSEDQLEQIGLVDVLVIPVGGSGYTLDATEAAAVVRTIEPKLVVPVQFAGDGVKYSAEQQSLELFTKELGAPILEPVSKYKVKSLPEQLSVQPITIS